MVFKREFEYSTFINELKEQIENTELSVFTKKTLLTSLNKINNSTKDTFTKEVMNVLNNKLTDNVNSKHTFIATIKSIIKNTNLKTILKKVELELIENEFAKLKEMKENKDHTQTANDKQNDRHVSFKEMKSVLNKNKDTLSKLDFLMYALYTYQEPVRADYNAVKIITDKYNIKDLDHTQNYYSIKDNKFILFEFKTNKIKQEPNVFKAPKELQKLITTSLTDTPREYLLYNENVGSVNKPITANYLSHKIQAISKILYDVPISINDIRHSFIAENNLENTSFSKVRKSADKMGHQVATANLIYKKSYDKVIQ